MSMPEFTAEAALGSMPTFSYRADAWKRGASAAIPPGRLGALTPALRIAPNLKPGDTWCDGTTMWQYQCTPSPYPGSPPDCEIVAVGSCPGGQSGPLWPGFAVVL